MCVYETDDGKCKRFSDDEVTSYCVGTPCEYEKLSNFDRIRNMSIDEMAELFYGVIHERDLHILKALNDNGIDASLVEAHSKLHISFHKKWLESEAK